MGNYKLVNLDILVVSAVLTNRACERIGGKKKAEHARCERRVREPWWAKRGGVHSVHQHYLPAAVVVVVGNDCFGLGRHVPVGISIFAILWIPIKMKT